MGILDRLFRRGPPSDPDGAKEAVLVYLDGTGLPDQVYEECDLATIEDMLIDALSRERTGEFDGNEFGPTEVTLFLYGPDAEIRYQVFSDGVRGRGCCAH